MKEVKEKGRRKRCKASKCIRRMKKNVREEQSRLREDSWEPKKQPKKSSSARTAERCQKPNSCQEKGNQVQQLQQDGYSLALVPRKRGHHVQQHQGGETECPAAWWTKLITRKLQLTGLCPCEKQLKKRQSDSALPARFTSVQTFSSIV